MPSHASSHANRTPGQMKCLENTGILVAGEERREWTQRNGRKKRDREKPGPADYCTAFLPTPPQGSLPRAWEQFQMPSLLSQKQISS